MAVLTFISCKENSNEKAYEENSEGESSSDKETETYAEIPIKEDGEWNERKYILWVSRSKIEEKMMKKELYCLKNYLRPRLYLI